MFKLTQNITNGFIDELEKVSTQKRKKLEKKLSFKASKQDRPKTPGSSMATMAGGQYAIGEFDDKGGTDKIMVDSENGASQDWMNL